MRGMMWLWLSGTVMLSACGGETPVPEQQAAQAPESSLAAASPSDLDPANCDKRPDFVLLPADAKVVSCAFGKGPSPRRESGTVIFLTASAPAAVTDWYRAQAKGLEMQDAVVASVPSPLYSAKDGTRRNFMVIPEPAEGRTRVTLNWGRDG